VVAFIEASQKRVVVNDVPSAVFDLFEADLFVVQRLAQKMLSRVQTEGAGPADLADFEMARIFRRGGAFRVGSG